MVDLGDAGAGGTADGLRRCAAGTPLGCTGPSLISCNTDGTAEVTTTCSLRCDAATPACENRIDPANGLAAALDAAAGEPALAITQSLTIDTDNTFDPVAGRITIGGHPVTARLVTGSHGGPDIVALSVGGLTVGSGATAAVFGARPIAIASAGDVLIDGTLSILAPEVIANNTCNGVASIAAGGDNDAPGGGGGGFGQIGAAGGPVLGVTTGKSGGTTTDDATLIPLRGGCKGGGDPLGAEGGYGGGAVQLVSTTVVHIGGAVGANGEGASVSGGGGSGGGILIEAPRVELTGGVFANGGGGGCGGFVLGDVGSNTVTPALGADCTGMTGTALHGGNGGAGTTAATAGGAAANRVGSIDRAGGGGGGVGRIRINTLDGTLGLAGTQSPMASLGRVAGRP